MDFSPSGWLLPLVATVVFYGLAQALTKQFMANVSAGAFIILGFYKLLAGFFFTEVGEGQYRLQPNFRFRRNPTVVVRD